MANDKNDTFVASELQTRSTARLAEEVSDEISQPDPEPAKAKAALDKALQDSDTD